MMFLSDTPSQHLENFLKERGVDYLSGLIRRIEAWVGGSLHLDPWDAYTVNPDHPRAVSAKISQRMAEICEANDRWRFLYLFRKLPGGIARGIVGTLCKPASEQNRQPILFEGTLHGTNQILGRTPVKTQFGRHADRYRFEPSQGEIEDALELAVLCFAQRSLIFFQNSIARRAISPPSSFDALVGVYDARLKRHWKPQPAVSASARLLVYPGWYNATKEPITWESPNGRYAVQLKNYVPSLCDADAELSAYGFLNHPYFEKRTGLRWQKWKSIWIGLNRSLIMDLPLFLSDKILSQCTEGMVKNLADRLDDYGDTGLGGGTRESLELACAKYAPQLGGEAAPTREECHRFVESLLFKETMSEDRFVEQPFIFYDTGNSIVLWDFLRNPAVLRSYARTMSSNSAFGEYKGKWFEKKVADAICSEVRGVSGLNTGVKIKENGAVVMEIDVGFVVDEVLVIVEVKHFYKPQRYYFDAGVEVSARVESFETILEKREGKLDIHCDRVRQFWGGKVAGIRGCIVVVCSEEADFVASADPYWWLSTLTIPRVCMVNELVEYLRANGGRKLEAHPAFRPFQV